jgi:cell division protein FtsW
MAPAYSSPTNRETPGKPDLVILGVTILLVMVGLIMVYSAKLYIDQSYLAEQAKRIAIGVALGVVGYFLPISWWGWRKAGWWVLILTVGALVAVRLFGVKHGGAARTWLGVQPSEFAKLAVAIFLAWYFQRLSQLREPERNFWRFLVRPLIFCAPVLALIVIQPAVSMALVVAVLIFSLLYLAEVKLRYLFTLGLVSAALFGAVMVKFSHTQRRSEAYLSTIAHLFDVRSELEAPEPKFKSILWQQRQSWIAIGSGGIDGKGLGMGKQKFQFLPKVHTDFIFALIGEEWGLFGSLLIFGLYLIFLWRGIYLIRRAADPFNRLLTAGIVLTVVFTALIHLGVTLKLLPPTGQTLPFVSYGGSALAANLFGIGLLLQLSRYIERRPVEDDFVSRCWNRWTHLSRNRAR